MLQSWTGLVREPLTSPQNEELARYLKWEYGDGTGVGFLNGHATSGRRARRLTERRFIEPLRRLSKAVRARIAAKPEAEFQRELSLLVQWKRGELGTTELVDRLEDLEFETAIAAANLCL